MYNYILLLLIAGVFVTAVIKKVDILSAFTTGVKEGLRTVARIFPILMLVLTAVNMFRFSGAMEMVIKLISPVTNVVGIPSEIVPMALLRPFSGSGALALLDNMLKTYGADTYIGRASAIIAASTETTLYTISIYLGGKTKKCGKLLLAAFTADIVSVIMACVMAKYL